MIKIQHSIYLGFIIIVFTILSCNKQKTASDILQSTIQTIDTIETIYYKQDMSRSNPRNIQDTIFRFREMYFKRLISDSIVGVKGHWYMYINDKENVIYEDIYDGNKLIRKNNRDSLLRIYDLVKYPEFKQKHFWSHNTLYGIQYEFKFMLKNTDIYNLKRLNDTILNNKSCYQVQVILENKTTMPGFAIKLEDQEGNISKTTYIINKQTSYPIGVKGVYYSTDNTQQKSFIDQKYYDIKFNLEIDESLEFNTDVDALKEFEKSEILPQ